MMLQREHVTRVLHCSAGNCIGRGKCYCIVSEGAAAFSQCRMRQPSHCLKLRQSRHTPSSRNEQPPHAPPLKHVLAP